MAKVTIAIPTYNRSKFLAEAIKSVLEQTYIDFELLIVDNASTDRTKKVVKSFNDPRINYHRNKKNIGMMRNWNKCIELSNGKYLMILGDDDMLYPNFIDVSLGAHEGAPKIGFSFAHCNKVDQEGKDIMRWGYKFTPSGYLDRHKYLHYTIKYGACLTNSSTVLINKKVFSKVKAFEAPYGSNTFDFNMWIKIGLKYPIYFIDEIVSGYRIHREQVSELHWRKMTTGKIGTQLELIGAIGYLLKEKECQNKKQRSLLTSRLIEINSTLSDLLKQSIPEL